MDQFQNERYRWVILGTLFSLHVFTSAGQFSIPPVLPFIKEDLGLNYTQVGLFTSSSYLGSALTATFAGWAVDSFGIKKMVVLGTILMGTCMMIASWMPSFLWVLILLLFSGISYSIFIPSTNKAAMLWFHQRLRATAIGIKQTGINGGGFVAAFSIPPLAMNFGWRLAFCVAGFFIFIGGIVMFIFYREFDPESYHQIPLRKWKYQIKQVISNRNVLILGIEGFFRIGIQSVFLTYLILYLQKVFQLHVITASSLFALGHFSGAIGRVTWGLLSDRIFGGERKKVYRFIAVISGVFFLALGHLTPVTPFWVVILVITLLGFTTVGSQGVGQSLIVEVAGKEFAGTASGFTQTFCFLGVVLMAPLFGYLLDTFGRYFYAWASLALFSFIAFGLVSLVKEGFKKTSSIHPTQR